MRRIQVLYEIDVVGNVCKNCERYTTQFQGRYSPKYCRKECPVGLELKRLGKLLKIQE